MNSRSAKELAEELGRQSVVQPIDTEGVYNLLRLVDVPPSSCFHKKIILPNSFVIEDGVDLEHHLSLTRVLINSNLPGCYHTSRCKRLWGAIALRWGYSSDVISRRLRDEPEIAEMIRQSRDKGNLYSLLGKLETFDRENPYELYITTRPVIVIPGITGRGEIQKLHNFGECQSLIEKEVPGTVFDRKRVRTDSYGDDES